MNPVTKTLIFRHACKSFDPRKKISKAHLDMILTAAHLSLSSFGMEVWKFIVIGSGEVKKSPSACLLEPAPDHRCQPCGRHLHKALAYRMKE